MERVHFIGIGGNAMHNLAIALHKKGYNVSGSDNVIIEPTHSRLKQYGLLPKDTKWHPEIISKKFEAIIVGVYIPADNPEILKAQELGIKLYSYPEFIYEQSKEKTRIVIGGSHGKTTITSIIIHALSSNNIDVDYLVGDQLDGFESMVHLTNDSNYIIIEGDEYLASAIDPRPKFHAYKPNIALISGIAWDHVNVFPSFYIYIDQFRKFIDSIEDNGTLIFNENDIMVKRLVDESSRELTTIPYRTHPFETFDNRNFLIVDSGRIPLSIFGEHNMQNIAGALKVCLLLGLSEQKFYDAMLTYKGASKRLQLLGRNESVNVYLDFAHSPSKLSATIKAVRQQFPKRHLVACMELHSFSSLNESFLEQYNGTMDLADTRFVYYNPKTIEHKGLKNLDPELVFNAFGNANIKVFTDQKKLLAELNEMDWQNKNLLFMTSGDFSGINFKEIVGKLTA